MRSEAECGIERIGCSLVLGPQSLDLSLRFLTKSHGGLVGVADIGELIADAVLPNSISTIFTTLDYTCKEFKV